MPEMFLGEDRAKRSGCAASGPVLGDSGHWVRPLPNLTQPIKTAVQDAAVGLQGGGIWPERKSDLQTILGPYYCGCVAGHFLPGSHSLRYHVVALARLCLDDTLESPGSIKIHTHKKNTEIGRAHV